MLIVVVCGLVPQLVGLQRSGQGSDGIFLALRWCPHPHCTGVIASVRLSLLPVLRLCCCQVGLQKSGWCSAGICRRCASVLLALLWHHCQHCAVVVVVDVVLASLPSSRWSFCLIALALLPSLPLRCRQHRKLASAQSRSSCNMRWHHC